MLLLKINMEAGHGGASGRFDRLKEVALDYAFALKVAHKAAKLGGAARPSSGCAWYLAALRVGPIGDSKPGAALRAGGDTVPRREFSSIGFLSRRSRARLRFAAMKHGWTWWSSLIDRFFIAKAKHSSLLQ